MGLIRLMQSNEGMSIMDATDKFEAHQFNFAGLSEVLTQFGQQLSGAAQIPLVRLFGQSPAGLNSTGESDIRNYYDMINSQQEAKLRGPVQVLLEVLYRSEFGQPLPDGFEFSFRPLWQLAEDQKAQASLQITQEVLAAYEQGVVGRKTVLKEMKEQSKWTGVWTNITDEEIEQADDEPPDPMQQQALQGESPGDPAKLPAPHMAAGASPTDMAVPPPGGARTASTLERVLAVLKPQQAAPGATWQQETPSKAMQVAALFGHHGKAAQVRSILTHDQLSLINWQGLNIVIEAERGQRRFGNGPSPAHYGYISATGSAEGGSEQMDCYIGDDRNAEEVYVIEQHKPEGGFDEHKVMLDFSSQQDAINAYVNAWDDGSGVTRLGGIKAMTIPTFKRWLQSWPYELKTERQTHQEEIR
jgi:hypothetical protein